MWASEGIDVKYGDWDDSGDTLEFSLVASRVVCARHFCDRLAFMIENCEHDA